MTVNRLLILLAFVCAVVGTILAFDVFGASVTAVQVLGWFGLALAFRFGADLA